MSAVREVRLAKANLKAALTHLQQARFLHPFPLELESRRLGVRNAIRLALVAVEILEVAVNEHASAKRVALRKQAKEARP